MNPLGAAGPRPFRPTWRMLLVGSLILAAIGAKFWIKSDFEVPLADERQRTAVHHLGAGGTGVFKKAGKASQRPAKRDS
jgi:hypothetical protein